MSLVRAILILMLATIAIAASAAAPAYAIQWSGSNGGDDTPTEDDGF